MSAQLLSSPLQYMQLSVEWILKSLILNNSRSGSVKCASRHEWRNDGWGTAPLSLKFRYLVWGGGEGMCDAPDLLPRPKQGEAKRVRWSGAPFWGWQWRETTLLLPAMKCRSSNLWTVTSLTHIGTTLQWWSDSRQRQHNLTSSGIHPVSY